jgi:hypothetical protein
MSNWQKPSKKYCDSAACVEVATHVAGYVQIRASWSPAQVAEFTPEEFSVFLRAVKGGEYDSYVL